MNVSIRVIYVKCTSINNVITRILSCVFTTVFLRLILNYNYIVLFENFLKVLIAPCLRNHTTRGLIPWVFCDVKV